LLHQYLQRYSLQLCQKVEVHKVFLTEKTRAFTSTIDCGRLKRSLKLIITIEICRKINIE
jgi:hypothetical protein